MNVNLSFRVTFSKALKTFGIERLC